MKNIKNKDHVILIQKNQWDNIVSILIVLMIFFFGLLIGSALTDKSFIPAGFKHIQILLILVIYFILCYIILRKLVPIYLAVISVIAQYLLMTFSSMMIIEFFILILIWCLIRYLEKGRFFDLILPGLLVIFSFFLYYYPGVIFIITIIVTLILRELFIFKEPRKIGVFHFIIQQFKKQNIIYKLYMFFLLIFILFGLFIKYHSPINFKSIINYFNVDFPYFMPSVLFLSLAGNSIINMEYIYVIVKYFFLMVFIISILMLIIRNKKNEIFLNDLFLAVINFSGFCVFIFIVMPLKFHDHYIISTTGFITGTYLLFWLIRQVKKKITHFFHNK